MEGKFRPLKRRLSAKKDGRNASSVLFYAVESHSIADAGVQDLADVPQVRDLLRGG